MTTILNVSLIFPINPDANIDFNKLINHCSSIEAIEQNFNIEFSCGDGKFYSDYWHWTDGGALIANYHTDEEYEEVARYDGKVCFKIPPRDANTKQLLKANKCYRFTIKYLSKTQQETYYINNKKILKKWVG